MIGDIFNTVVDFINVVDRMGKERERRKSIQSEVKPLEQMIQPTEGRILDDHTWLHEDGTIHDPLEPRPY